MIEFYFNLALKTISKGHINYQTETENNTHGKIYTQHSKTQEMSKNERHDVTLCKISENKQLGKQAYTLKSNIAC